MEKKFFKPEQPEPKYNPAPSFRFKEAEKEAMREKGMSDEEIARKEEAINARLRLEHEEKRDAA